MRIDTSKDMFSAKTLNSFGFEKSNDGEYFIRTALDAAKSKVLGTTVSPTGMITYDEEGVNSLFRLVTIGLLSVNSANI